ncbi:MAG: holo-ACP synthase, partial [Acetanaerobacterium sp.]
MTRVFSREEILLFEQRRMNTSTIAANWAGKEAFCKSLGTGLRGFALNEISVLRDELGAPYLRLSGRAQDAAQRRGLRFSISLSHT